MPYRDDRHFAELCICLYVVRALLLMRYSVRLIPESDCDCHIDMNLRYLPFDESLVRDLIIAIN